MATGPLVGGPKNGQNYTTDAELGVIFTNSETSERHFYRWDDNLNRFGYMMFIGETEGLIQSGQWEVTEL